MLILGDREVRDLLDRRALIDALGVAMVELSRGEASVPPRVAAEVAAHGGSLFAMPGYVPGLGVLAAKLVSLFPRNETVPTHHAVIVCFDPATGEPLAILDGTHITAERTAAGSALATRLLARPGANTLTIVGTGAQARSHARCFLDLFDLATVIVVGRSEAKAQAVVDELEYDGDTEIRATTDLERALGEADVVCAATHSDRSVVRRQWLKPGVHVNSVGYNAAGREVDQATVTDSLVVVEARSSALARPPGGAPELVEAIENGSLRAEDVVEVGELITGAAPGRTSDEQITLYRSVGVAVQDAAAAHVILHPPSRS